jgi:hypothetical protein
MLLRAFPGLSTLSLLFLAACGAGGGDAGGPSPAPAPAPVAWPVVDVAVHGNGPSGAMVHVYRDALDGPATGKAPDVRVVLPAQVEHVAFTGTHLVVASDFGVPAQNRFFVYGPADLAASPPLPSVQVMIVPYPGATGVVMRDLRVWKDDVYVLSVYDDGQSPVTLTSVTHVFRGLTTLTNGSAATAAVVNAQVTTSLLMAAHDSLAVDDDVLLATGLGKIAVVAAPSSLVGLEFPGLVLVPADLGLGTLPRIRLASGAAYFHGVTWIHAFGNAAGLAAGQTADFVLDGPSEVLPTPNALVRLRDRLFSRGLYPISTSAVVGFDVGGAVPSPAPPDVELGPPLVGDQLLDGAGDALFAAASDTGLVAGYGRASLLATDDEPTVLLYDPEITSARELRVAAP